MFKKGIILLLLLLVLFISPVYAEEILYEENVNTISSNLNKVGTNLAEYINENVWVSNNSRVYTLKYLMDNDSGTLKQYVLWQNYFPDSNTVQNSTDKRALAQDEYLKLYINDLNIDTSKYNDIRLDLDYLTLDGNSIAYDNSLLVYIIDENNQIIGPYYLSSYSATGYYKRDNNDDKYARGYHLITENLNTSTNIIIKKLLIIPYGNKPLRVDNTLTFSSDWRQQTVSFLLSSIKIVGYGEDSYRDKSIKIIPFDVVNARINAVKRMYDLATIKWIPDSDMNTIWNDESLNKVAYYRDNVYYGVPYTQQNRVTVEKFDDYLDDNNYYNVAKDNDGTQSRQTIGADCAASVSYSISKFVPLPSMYTTGNFVWDRNKTKLLGNLEILGTDPSTMSVYNRLYNEYLNRLNNSELDENLELAKRLFNQRIRSNDIRTWYITTTDRENNNYLILGYTDSEYVDENDVRHYAIRSGESLKLSVKNLDIASDKEIKLSFKYYINKNKKNNLNERLDTNTIIVNFCNNNNECVSASNIYASDLVSLNDTFDMETINVNYNNNGIIDYIEIIPYGQNKKTGKVFRLNEVSIDVDNKFYYKNSVAVLNTMFDLENNNSNHLIDESIAEKINGEDEDINEQIAKYVASQKIFKAYQELKIGDIVATHSKEGYTHVRLITGSTHIECLDGTVLENDNSQLHNPIGNCNNHLGINSKKSYFIRTDIKSGQVSTTYVDRDNYGGLLGANDYAVPFTPNSNYTDINSLSDLEGKNLNFYINKKNYFWDAFDNAYLPITFNDYLTETTEKVFAQLINGNTLLDITDGLKGTIYSNYSIISVNFEIKNLITNENISRKVYPTHERGMKESQIANFYSLFYNTPDDIKTLINETVSNVSNYEINISVDAGTDSYIPILSLKRNGDYLLGDMNKNGRIDLSDIIMLLKVYLNGNPTDEELQIGDLDGNETIGLKDIILLLKTYLDVA